MPQSSRRVASLEALGLAALAVLGLAVFAHGFATYQPSAKVRIEINREQAIQIAMEALEELGGSMGQITPTSVSFRTQSDWNAFLQTEAELPADLERFRPYSYWDVILSESGRDRPIRVGLSPDGKPFTVRQDIRPEEVGAQLSVDEAQEVARRFFGPEYDLTDSEWSLEDERVDQYPSRSDHTLRWERSAPGAPGATLSLYAVVAGDKVRSWSRSIELPEDFRARFEPKASVNALFDFGVFLLVTLIWLAALTLFALRFRTGEVGIRNGFYVVFALLIAYVWYAYNSSPYSIHLALLEEDAAIRTVVVYLGIGIQIFFTALGQFFVWNSGEAYAREVWPSKLVTFDKLFAQRLFTRDVGAGILRGMAMAAVTVGGWYLLLPLFIRGQWAILSTEDLLGFSSFIPTGQPIAVSLTTALLATAYAELFSLSTLRFKMKRLWPALILVAVAFGAAFSDTTILLSRWNAVVPSILVGLVGYAFFLRYDLWTVFVGVLSAGILLRSAAFLVHPAFEMAGITSLVALAAFALYGLIAFLRGRDVTDASVTPAYVRFISERERLKLELDIARQAQLKMLPERVPKATGLDMAAFSEPAREVGGDYYDFLPFPDGRLGIVVGDVSGKGMPAALYMTMLKGYLQSRSETDSSPLSVLSHVNRMFGQSSDRAMFATMVYCVLDVAGGTMTFARAGHCPVIVFRESDSSVYVLQPPGIGIGLERTDLFERVTREETLDVRAGDVVVLYSDGLTEARDTSENEFGTQRLVDLVRTSRGSAESILNDIRKAHAAFVGAQEPHDDLTCVVIRLVP